MLRFPYTIERGVRYPDEPLPVIGFRRHVMESREPLLINVDVAGEAERYGNPFVRTGEPAKSWLGVPFIAAGRAGGVISLQNLDQEYAFTDSDKRLLATLAGSLSVALDNARLIQETQRRVAELATINSVGEALAGQLELDALIELVGDRVRETFDADIAYVALHDESTGQIEFAYYHEGGERRDEPAIPYGEGLTSQILRSREPLVINRSLEQEDVAYLGTPSRSYLGVPIVAGERAIGVISIQSTKEEGRFGEGDAGLLSTIAANVGIAIQNAQLYEETRRRGDEMAALAEVGREFSSAVDMAAVLDRVAERARDLLDADTSAVYLAEPEAETFRAAVALGDNAEEIKADRIRLGEGIIGTLAARREAEVVNDTSQDPRAQTIPGTEEVESEERLMVAPLLAGGQAIGMTAVWREGGSKRPFTQADLDLLVGLSQAAAGAIANARLLEAQREAEERFRRLAEELPLVTFHGRAVRELRRGVDASERTSTSAPRPRRCSDTRWPTGRTTRSGRRSSTRTTASGCCAAQRRFQETGEPLSIEYRMRPQERPRRLGARRVGDRPRRERRSALRAGLLDRHHRAQGARGGAASSRGRALPREAALRVTRGSEPDGDRHDGSGRAGHLLEPGCGAVVRLEPGRGTGPQHRRARVGLGRAARGRRGGDPPGTRGRPCDTDDPPNPQGRQAGRRRAAVGSPCRRRRSHRLPARLPRHHGREGGRDAVPPARRGAAARHLRRCAVRG